MASKHFLTSNFRVAFEEYFKPEQQRSAVDNLQNYIAQVRDGTEEERRSLQVLRPQDTTQEQKDARVAAHLDKCYWQLAQFYRVRLALALGPCCTSSRTRTAGRRCLTRDPQYSVPCRIAEAETLLRDVIRYAQRTGAKRDVTPELYLAVAIHNTPEKEQEALTIFASAFSHVEESDAPGPGPRSELWARASCARLLRRLGRAEEAETQEAAILYVQVRHPSLFFLFILPFPH